MKIKYIIFDWGGTLGKAGQKGILIKSKKNKSLTALKPDTIRTLKGLKKKGIHMAILSNTKYTRKQIHKGLVKTGIKKYFDFEVYSSDKNQSCAKPCKDIYSSSYKNVKRFMPNIRKKQILYVGDNYYADIMGAQNFGFSTAYIVNEDLLKYYLADLLGSQDITLYKISDLLEQF